MNNLQEALRLNLFEELSTLPESFGEVIYSEKHKKYMNRLFDKMRGDRYHKLSKKAQVIILIAAIMLLLLVSGIAANNQLNFTSVKYNNLFELSFDDKNAPKKVYDLTVGYVPEGFVLDDNKNHNLENSDWGFYAIYNKENAEIYISKHLVNGVYGVSTDEYDNDVVINGITYTYHGSKEYNLNGYVWNDGKYFFTIEGNISKEELLKMAQEIH